MPASHHEVLSFLSRLAQTAEGSQKEMMQNLWSLYSDMITWPSQKEKITPETIAQRLRNLIPNQEQVVPSKEIVVARRPINLQHS